MKKILYFLVLLNIIINDELLAQELAPRPPISQISRSRVIPNRSMPHRTAARRIGRRTTRPIEGPPRGRYPINRQSKALQVNAFEDEKVTSDPDFIVPETLASQQNQVLNQTSTTTTNQYEEMYLNNQRDAEVAREQISPELVKGEAEARRKMREIKRLTGNAARHFMAVPLADACADFLYNPIWRKGELSIFVYDQDGVNYVHGDDINNIWQNMSNIKSIGGTPLIRRLFQTDQNGKSIGYIWDNAYKSSYVRVLVKDGMKYVLGAGFFPEDNEFRTKELVKSAVNTYLTRGREETFALINNPEGPFVKGNVYSFVFDFEGLCLAHGDNVALIGQNLLDLTDSRGDFLIRRLIAVAKRKGAGWVNYYWKNSFKRAYVERLLDPKTKKPFLIAAGYYPYEDFQALKTFVNRAVSFLKSNGAAVAFPEFSNTVGSFARGGFAVIVFDLEGKCLANGHVPEFVGQNLIKRTGMRGEFYVKEIIDTAKRYGKGVVTYFEKNANTVVYLELVDIPDGKFVVLSKYYPASKVVSVQTLVESAIEYFKRHKNTDAFYEFSRRSGQFFQGDLHIFVYDDKGNRLVKGPNKENLWRNFMKTTDQDGRPIVSDFITTAINGGGWLEYKTRNALRRIYVKPVTKLNKLGEPETYIIGSGYFV